MVDGQHGRRLVTPVLRTAVAVFTMPHVTAQILHRKLVVLIAPVFHTMKLHLAMKNYAP